MRAADVTGPCCASPRPDRSTTASPRSSAGCSTTRSRSSRTSSRRSSATSRAAGRRARSTWRCSPTACGPSASRASPSTSPTATSPRPSASSSSPTRPGHIQYTRNMVTGASTADLALILIDARKGVLEQSRRHAFIATLLGIPHLVVCVNKMDLVDYDRGGLRARSSTSSRAFAARLDVTDLHLHPDLGAARRQRGASAPSTCPGTTARRCCTTWRRAHRRDRNLIDAALPGAVRHPPAPTPDRAPRLPRLRRARSPAACSSRATRWSCLPSGLTTTHRVHRHRRRSGRRGVRRRCRSPCGWRTTSTSPAAT